ncbi:MAG: abortive infection family protein [Eggerthellales bacterium]|nr:abortive infection family protein [Eggerthellales bacterium]
MPLTQSEKQAFLSLFNRNGYVLNFSTAAFDAFSHASVGIKPCSKYGLSKGGSLECFVAEYGPEADRLLLDLFDYYQLHYRPEFDPDYEDEFSSRKHVRGKRSLYASCKDCAERERARSDYMCSSAEYLKGKFSSEYMASQIDLLMRMREENPTEAIGKAKELLESCCKTILEEQDVEIERTWDVSRLTKETLDLLNVKKDSISNSLPEGKTVNKILGSLNGLVSGIVEFRNQWGSGHGKSASYERLSKRHAKLAVGSSVTLVEYLWDTYEWRKSQGLFD